MLTVLSFDIDRTLVDRAYSNHAIEPGVSETLRQLSLRADILLVLNTGRDIAALKEFDECYGSTFDAICLSGRVLRYGSKVLTDEDAIVHLNCIKRAIELLKDGTSPYIDIKDSFGALKIVGGSKGDNPSLPFGSQKPPEWYKASKPEVITTAHTDFITEIMCRKPIRLEIPIVLDDQSHPLCKAFETADKLEVFKLLELPENYYIGFHSTHPGHTTFAQRFGFIQVLSPDHIHNKGSGLAKYLDLIDQPIGSIIHYGDSDSHHNDDSIVAAHVPKCQFVRVSSPSELRFGSGDISKALFEKLDR
jgi:hydroxymethylpyrimidine pyrophosphatase-like HAD family hydrolase